VDTLNASPARGATPAARCGPVTLDVMLANEKNPHAAADIVCDECKSIIATLHTARQH
jgi:hypothetical protein